jgi:hypothetical protein
MYRSRLGLLMAIVCQLCLISLGCSGETTSNASAGKRSNPNGAAPSKVKWVGVDSGYRSDGHK